MIEHLLKLADEYAKAEGVALSVVSWRVFGDSKKLNALRTGSDIQVRRFQQALEWFSRNWPVGVAWPAEIGRPSEDAA